MLQHQPALPTRPHRFARIVAWLCALALLLPAAAPAAAAPAGVGPKQPKSGGTLVIARRVDAIQFDPVQVDDNPSLFLVVNLYDGLLNVPPEGVGTEPGVAASWEVAQDGRVYTFRIRDGIRFRDGTSLTSADVKWSIDRVRSEKGTWKQTYETITEVEALDEKTVRITQSIPWSPLPAALAMFPAGIASKATFDVPNPDWDRSNGSGPYYLDRWERKSELVFKKNPYYWKPGQPYLDEIIFKIVPDDNARILMMQGGQIDVINDLPLNQVDILNANPNVTAKVYPIQAMTSIGINNEKEPLDDVKIRQALNYATDKDALNRVVYFGKAEIQTSPIPKGAFFDSSLKGYPYDLAKARELMAQSKAPNGFTVEFIVQSGNLTNNQIATFVKEQWRQIGVEVNIVQMEAANARTRIRSGEYQLAVSGWTNDMDDPTQVINYTANGEYGTYATWTRYNNPQVNQWIRQADLELDPQKRQQLYSQIQRQVLDDAPRVFLVFWPEASAYGKHVEGFFIGGLSYFRLENIWINK